MKFTRRYECPEPCKDKYYLARNCGGWNPCIPRPSGSSLVFANCVFYAVGRFNEIAGANGCPHLGSVNAENFVQMAKNQGLTVSQTPTLGGCMVWAAGEINNGNDGCGHVAIVEAMTESGIITSESGWNAKKAWRTTERSGSNWGMGESYRYLGCITNPAFPFDVEPATLYRVQVGAFVNYDNAKRYCDQLNRNGIEAFIVKATN